VKHLYVQPFVGEFGWEVCRWQCLVRSVASRYDTTTVCCEDGHEWLYWDFAEEIETINVRPRKRNMYTSELGLLEYYGSGNRLMPSKELCLCKQDVVWYRYRSHDPIASNTILIHNRTTKNYSTEERNWPNHKWDALAYALKDFRIITVGSLGGAGRVRGCEDMRGVGLDRLSVLCSEAKCIVGPSSGPMHYASMCECPQVVWSENKTEVIGCTNEVRYKTAWNPFGTPVEYLPTWQPEVVDVVTAVRRFL